MLGETGGMVRMRWGRTVEVLVGCDRPVQIPICMTAPVLTGVRYPGSLGFGRGNELEGMAVQAEKSPGLADAGHVAIHAVHRVRGTGNRRMIFLKDMTAFADCRALF